MAVSVARSRLVHFFVAAGSAGGFLLLVALLPSLKDGTNGGVVTKCVAEILATVLLLWALIRSGWTSAETVGVRAIRGSTIGWALICFLVIALLSALTLFAFSRFGITQNAALLKALAARPVPIVLLIAATAGIAEEIIFRAVLISQLEAATGMTSIAAAVSLLAFAASHARGWGPMQVVFAAVPGLVLTLFFLWKRNLWICILAHFLTDATGLLSGAAAMAQHHR